ncbi:hypothetical protein HaLaN_02411 [Haematococcus lacustris]|uniref:Uncharacterized protein n=1 Tax=Haematococcus lacustris TaxID=44745 RepID=A0A699YNA4_HAELA|nr:hypothetical protein HaLaN_02411 [Haematococcus lacustris]
MQDGQECPMLNAFQNHVEMEVDHSLCNGADADDSVGVDDGIVEVEAAMLPHPLSPQVLSGQQNSFNKEQHDAGAPHPAAGALPPARHCWAAQTPPPHRAAA